MSDKQAQYESPAIRELGRLHDLTLGLTGDGADLAMGLPSV